MKLNVRKGTTSKTLQFFVNDTSVTNGGGLTGLSSTSGSLTAYYYREGNTVTTSLPLTNSSLGVWASGGIATVDGTNMPGLYQLGIPDAAFATGASSLVVVLRGAANMAPVLMEAQLVDFNPDDSVRMGLTALPNAVAGSNGGLPTGNASGQVAVASITSAVVTDIWNKALTELSAVPGVTASILDALNWVFTLARNKRTQTSVTETVYKDDGSTSLATSTKADDGSTFTRGEFS